MRFKNFIFILALFMVLLCCFSAVSASEDFDDSIAVSDDVAVDEVISEVDSNDESISVQENEEIESSDDVNNESLEVSDVEEVDDADDSSSVLSAEENDDEVSGQTPVASSQLNIKNLNTIAGTKLKNIKYTITDHLGNDIHQEGYFRINGKNYNSLRDFTAPKKPGTYTYNVKFISHTLFYSNTSATLKIVNKLKTKIKTKSVSGYENKKVKLTATIKDNLGKNVKKGVVIFKIRGKSYKVYVKNGKATKTIKIPKPGSRSIYYYYSYKNGREIQKSVYEDEVYKCSVVFKGDSKYLKSSSKFKITSKKKSTSKRYYTPYNTPPESPSSSYKKSSSSKKTTTKKTTTKSYGYYPTYHKLQPCIDVDLFKKTPTINPYTNLNNIIITA